MFIRKYTQIKSNFFCSNGRVGSLFCPRIDRPFYSLSISYIHCQDKFKLIHLTLLTPSDFVTASCGESNSQRLKCLTQGYTVNLNSDFHASDIAISFMFRLTQDQSIMPNTFFFHKVIFTVDLSVSGQLFKL